jgi:hypothetical protein
MRSEWNAGRGFCISGLTVDAVDVWRIRIMKHHFRRPLFLLAITCLALMPAHARTISKPPRPGREFELHVGQRVNLYKTKLSLKFVAVLDDSRCPSDVTCVWAGNARVQVQVSNGRNSKTLTLNSNTTAPPPSDGSFAGYTVKLIRLDPYPRSTVKIALGSYVLKLIVSKN